MTQFQLFAEPTAIQVKYLDTTFQDCQISGQFIVFNKQLPGLFSYFTGKQVAAGLLRQIVNLDRNLLIIFASQDLNRALKDLLVLFINHSHRDRQLLINVTTCMNHRTNRKLVLDENRVLLRQLFQRQVLRLFDITLLTKRNRVKRHS